MPVLDLIDTVVGALAAVGTIAAVGVALKVSHDESAARRAADERATAADERATRAESESRTERERADAERERVAAAALAQAHRAQALQVIAWPEQRPRPGGTWTGIGGNRFVETEQIVRVVNASTAVVFDIEVDVEHLGTYTRGVASLGVLPPGGERTWVLEQELPERASVFVQFRDLRATWWRRNQNGYLVQTHPNGLPDPEADTRPTP